ncbi:hypothetical protein SEA_LEONARD_76 [Gordonia phage Leonard]|uniref:DNA binding protein n=1 Tax=Gordonia phage Leonard TaxID=2656539 RepID=A0A649VM62_9CAUD|nr:hypothetical protein BI045_gp76 [Gordonia phage Phinally]YP_010002295.1 hypothetical protein J1769_gp76 [Gordonia phage Leonard]AMS03068.1 hypothetical protein SEA_PHINALLY_76 [Gordonia phage Phinally]QGJ93438.1 hypothetical protein SEA_LEONARD_76 [Gordonia phage Leonard]
MPPRRRKAPARPLGKACTVCGLPVVVAPGDWHASCAKRCTVCHDPVLSTDPGGDPTVHEKCAQKRTRK